MVGPSSDMVTCPSCNGHGYAWEDLCHLCSGSGKVTQEELEEAKRHERLAFFVVLVVMALAMGLVLV